ncbi:hypothetical protein ACFYW1_03910 [Streptomyces sp. NPDC002669]|uniref:hypothetical protein n=1 Tax=Streptomyces sp. NPDC002669 TaxID=3364658 RepID=UPI0036B0E161
MSPAATGPHVDETGARVVGEAGLLEYDDCQVSAIRGLRDVFRVAGEYAVEPADPPSVIRVSTWAVSATDAGPVMVCTSDTHPELAHRLGHVIMTAAGILAWVELGLTLVDRMPGPSVMLDMARFVLADPPRRRQSPHQEFTPRLQHGDTDIREGRAPLHACLHEPHSVEHLVQTAAMQPRTFQRRFQEATGLTAPDTSGRRASRRLASCWS